MTHSCSPENPFSVPWWAGWDFHHCATPCSVTNQTKFALSHIFELPLGVAQSAAMFPTVAEWTHWGYATQGSRTQTQPAVSDWQMQTLVQDRSKNAGRMKLWAAIPVDQTVHAHQGNRAHVADDSVILDRLIRHRSVPSLLWSELS